MFFAIWAPDKPGALDQRMKTRPRHLDYWENCEGVRVVLGGPMLTEEAEDLCGTMLIIETEDMETARRRAEKDPYWLDGVFERIDIKQVRLPLGDLAEKV